MKVRFDSLDRFEVPKFYICNPGCVYEGGVLSNTIGCLSDTSDEELIINFNTTSELNFRAYRVPRNDSDENSYVLNMYYSLKNRRLIFVEDVGFFVISEVVDGFEDGIHYKDVKAESCEYEISNKALPYIEDGTYLFTDLLETVVESIPVWKIGNVNEDVANKYRTFEGVSVDKNALSFLLEDMQDAYECIFEMDGINRIINVYDQNYYVNQTSIYITKDDLINSIEIKESSDDLYTALNVQGDDNLNISPVNPIGGNVIYNFSYYLDWMTPSLSEKVRSWSSLVSSKHDYYYNLNLQYYEKLTEQSEYEYELNRLETQLDMYKRCRDNIVAEGTTTTVESYNEIIEKNGGIPVGVQPEISSTIREIETLIENVNGQIEEINNNASNIANLLQDIANTINSVHEEVGILSYFTDEEYEELSNYIFEGNYDDEYIAVTQSMTYSEKFQQMKVLYDRANARLERVSEPTQEFDIDVENFIFEKEFSTWSEQLETGSLINVELDVDDVAALFLSNFIVNYDDKTLSMTFGNRFNRFDPKAMFENVLGDIKKSSNSISYIKDILYPVKNGEFNALKNAIESSGVLTKNAALASTNQEILIDDTGVLCRRISNDGYYEPKQLKITNQTIVFTDDGWETSRTGLGNFLFNNPFTGDVEEHYGVIADSLIGSLVLSEEVGVYNTENSITLNEDGLTITSDYTNPNEPSRKVFTIQKRQADDSGNEYYTKQLYIDDSGNLVLNGTLSVFTSNNENVNLEDLNNGITLDEVYSAIGEESKSIYDEMNNKYSNIVGQTTNQINSAVNAESQSLRASIESKYDNIMSQIDQELAAHKADVGQYMTFNESGLTLGATSSDFKTVIDNSGMYFKQKDTVVSYVNNNQLYIPNAVIESTLILGNFFFSPRDDGGFSLVWQE